MNKTVIVTGGTSGIGKMLADVYRKRGDKVFVFARDVEKDTEEEIKVDVCDEQNVKAAVDYVGKKCKTIDIVVNCAGYGLAGAVELTPLEDAKRQFDTNFFGTFLVDKYAIPYMKKGSVIVNISSACALFALPYRGFYCASKSAVCLFSESLSIELAPSGIKVVSICPGDVKTNFCKNRIKVYETNERYGDNIQKSLQKVDGNQERRMLPEYVAKKIAKISLKKNPKPMYIIGRKYKFLYFLSRVFPKKTMLYFTKRMFGRK